MGMLEKRFQTALSLFEEQNFRQSICEFVDLHQMGYRTAQILDILNEACFFPNMEEMKNNFQENVRRLKQYPYVLGGEFCSFEELSFRLYMISDSEFYIFDQTAKQFTELYQFEDGSQVDVRSMRVDAPIRFENETNLSHLTFLNDVIRKSEDAACDNHIYLYYDSFQQLAQLLLVTEIEPLLAEQKFVFLFGEKNRNYSLDSKTLFGFDYSSFRPKELSVNEIKRIVFGWKIANASGTSFFADIMDFHPDLLTIPDCIMYSFADFYLSLLKGKTRSEAISFLRRLPNTDSRKACLINLVCNKSDTLSEQLQREFNRVSADEFLNVLESVMENIPKPSAKEWLIGIYLTYSRCHGRKFGRVIPALFLYPHDDMFYLAGVARDTAQFYFDLVECFPYRKCIAVIRNPITQAGSVVNFMTNGHPNARNAQGKRQLDPFYCLAFGSILPKDYYFPLQHPLRKDIRVVRFEDLKLNPEATLASMSEFLNIPVTDSMFHTTWCGLTRAGVNTENAVFDGFDPAPVYKSYDQYLSVFDKYRIELLLSKRLETYGYRAEYYDGQHFSDKEIIAMMELPFKCEEIETVVPIQQRKSSRQTGMQFIRFALAIKEFPFTVNGTEGQFAPLLWLQPKEDMLREPLYETRR